MDAYQILALIIAAMAVLSVLIFVPALIVGARTEARAEAFNTHVADDLNMIAADDRNTRLDANANGSRWQS